MEGKAQSQTAGVIALPPLIYLAALIIGVILQVLFSRGFLPTWEYQLFGIIFFGLGLYLAISARRVMVDAGTNINPMEPTLALVKEGPYRFTRNPMYLGLSLAYLGISFLFNTLWILALLPVVLVIMQFGVILREERYLESLFGKNYSDYKSRVRRWI